MWRGSYTEDWERKKQYLTRTLFQGIPLLSPVPEEEDPDNDSLSSAWPSSGRIWAQTEDRRPYSPLPPLIVEREPNRHDHPEEFYEALAVKMRQYLQELSHEESSSGSSFEGYVLQRGSSSIEMDLSGSLNSIFKENMEAAKYYSDKIRNLVDESRSLDENQDKDSNKTTSDNGLHSSGDIYTKQSESYKESVEPGASNLISETNEERSGQLPIENSSNDTINNTVRSSTTSSASSVSSDPGAHYHQVTFEAEVHREASTQDDASLSSVYEQSVSEADGQLHHHQEEVNFEKPRDSITQEIETMRNTKAACIRTSYGNSLQHPTDESDEQISPEAIRRSLEDDNPLDTARGSHDILKMLQTSTPKTVEKRRMDSQKVADDTSSSHHKRGRYNEVVAQGNQIKEWSELRRDFFVGIPKIFNLCACKNHKCAG